MNFSRLETLKSTVRQRHDPAGVYLIVGGRVLFLLHNRISKYIRRDS